MENEVLNAIRERRSIRRYKPEQITDEELRAVLEAGTWAATAIYAVCGVISAAALVRMCVLVRRIKKEDCTAAE